MRGTAIASQLGALAAGSLLTGCVSFTYLADIPDTATRVTAATFNHSDQCTRSIEVRLPITNSTELPKTQSLTKIPHLDPAERHGISKHNDLTGYSITDDRPALLEAYVPQATPETCYAAVLAIVWRAAGTPQTESSFTDAVSATCGNETLGAANYLQILSAVSFVHEGKRFDPYTVRIKPLGAVIGQILSRDGSDTKYFRGISGRCLPPICLFGVGTTKLNPSTSPSDGLHEAAPLERRSFSDGSGLIPETVTVEEDAQNVNGGLRWQSHRDPTITGGVFPLRNAADILYALSHGAYVVAGLHRSGHVVIIDGIHIDEKLEVIDRLRIIDPADPENRHYWVELSKGRDLDGVSFALSIWNV